MSGPACHASARPLQSLIVYGTCRGTTETVARAIADGMSQQGVSASALSVEYLNLMPQRVEQAEILGVGTPVFFLREPAFITAMLSNLPSLEGKKAFVFCTSGMDLVGETLHRMMESLTERGATVVGADSFRTAMSYYPHRIRGLGNPQEFPDEKEVAAARQYGQRMSAAFDLPPLELKPVSWLMRWKARLLANQRLRKTLFPSVKIKLPQCTGYGSCLSRCPFHGLERHDGEEIPYYTDTCIGCLECIDWCPKEAIVSDSALKEWISTLSYRLNIH